MIDNKAKNRLDEIDKVLANLTNINKKLYYKAKESDLDEDTIDFLIYIAELLQNLQLDLKDANINFIKDFIPSSFEKKQLLCRTIAEKSDMEQEQYKKQLEFAKYISDSESMREESIAIRH